MPDPVFLKVQDILFIHQQELKTAGGAEGLRVPEAVDACVEAPKASYEEEYLQDIFQMAASYIACLAIRHPFFDGNKRTALAAALTFLYLNGYTVNESYDEELADLLLDFLVKKVTKDELAESLRSSSVPR